MCGRMSYLDLATGVRIYQMLKEIGIMAILERQPGDAIRFMSPGLIDLNVDLLTPTRIALAHYGVLNGDRMADPDMEIEITGQEAHAQTWQNDYVAVFRRVEGESDPMQCDLDEFLVHWLSTIKASGYIYEM